MANNYKTPGVYVEEISKLPPSVAQVETAIPAFIGFTEKAERNGINLVDKPTRVKSLAEYEEWFGSINPSRTNSTGSVTNISIDVSVEINNDAITKILPVLSSSSTIFRMYHSLQLYFSNGGGPCYIVSAETTDTIDIGSANTEIESAIEALKYEDEPTIIVLPDAHLVTADASYYSMYDRALVQSADLGDRVTIIDIKTPATVTDDPVEVMRDASLTNLKYGATYYPDLRTTLNHFYDDNSVNVTETVDGVTAGASVSLLASNLNLEDLEYNAIKGEIRKLIKVELPPGSAMAGIYARVDNDRGVWKAPANVTVSAAVEPTIKISDEDQKGLNVDTTAGKSVNAIRFFTGKGILVWGARTLAGNDNEWRYISVRRFYNMVEESVKKSSSWVVFEPNDANTWTKVKSMIVNYLTVLWRQGALAGSTPESAFFVNVGLGETMTSLDILEGRMNIEIGMAAVRPAEFIILKFSHKLQEA
ncbi:MAG: phage tail sheath family protein [Candidatus Scalindua sp.]|nr:phage tail sheath family protein [Candidatus Scalindua sp.]